MNTTLSFQPPATQSLDMFPEDPRRETWRRDTRMRPMPARARKPVTFEIAADQGRSVYVSGTFNNWSPTAHPLYRYPEDGVFRTVIRLPAGTHEYKFVVDGIWQADVNCPHWLVNEYGTLNSVIHV